MERVNNLEDIKNLHDNEIIGNPKLNNAKINFTGKNNTLICHGNLKIENSIIAFNGNDSIVYLCSDLNNSFSLVIHNNSTIFIGKDVLIGSNVSFNVQESQNVIIGDDCILGNQLNIFTSDNYPIYRASDKQRINFSKSVYIGDHVWIGRFAYVSKGVKIGSGSIVADKSYLPNNTKVPSNCYIAGNPVRIVEKDVFFTKDYVGFNKSSDSVDSKDYTSNVFIYDFINRETLDLNKIDKIIKDLAIPEKIEFMEKLFIKNKYKNRFTIQ